MPEAQEPKFTRGEKCIFIHLIVSFFFIIILIIIYFVHICVVQHRPNELFWITRRTNKEPFHRNESYYPIGFIYLNKNPHKIMCNVILLRVQWSVAPAHCASIRSDPDLANMLDLWRIKYKTKDDRFLELKVKKSIIHWQFNRIDFQNNIGLFLHENVTSIIPYDVTTISPISPDVRDHGHEQMFLINWDLIFNNKSEKRNVTAVYLVTSEKCLDHVSQIIDEKRQYEFCAKPTHGIGYKLDHGAAFVVNSKIIGFLSWGDRLGNGTPFIVIGLSSFQTWLENAMIF